MVKRGQISLFVIIGFVILLSAAIFIFFKEGSTLFRPEGIAPEEIKPIKQYTETCLNTLARDGTFLLMQQGGYIVPEERFPDWSYALPRPYLDVGGFKVPYWFYNGRSRMPVRNYPDFDYEILEAQLNVFITEGLTNCLEGYQAFNEEYDIAIKGDMIVSSAINEQDITILLDYPLEIRDKMSTKVTDWNEFSVKVSSSIGKLFKLAYLIMLHEDNGQFLEILTDDMIASSDWLPYEGMEFTCMPKSWFIPEVKEYIQTLISANIRFLFFEGTDHDDPLYAYYDDVNYKIGYRQNIGAEDFSTIRVNTIYQPSWELKLDVTPRRGSQIKPIETPVSPLIGSCIKIYHHKYDLEYPVVFQLIDTNRPDEQFFFVTPVYVKDNLANRGQMVVSWPPDINIQDSTEYCSNTTTETIVVIDELSGQLVTYPDELVEKDFYPLSVIVTDAYTREPIYNASVSFQCVGFLCEDMGYTDYPRTADGLWTGQGPRLTKMFPPCVGGQLLVRKEGYLDGRAQQTTSEETENVQVTVELVAKKDKRFQMKVEQDSAGTKSTRNLLEDETAIVIIKNAEMDIDQYLVFDSAGADEQQELFLALGDYTYEVDIKLIDNDRLVGGSFLNWTPTALDVQNKQTVVFYATRKVTLTAAMTDEENWVLWEHAVENSRAPVLI